MKTRRIRGVFDDPGDKNLQKFKRDRDAAREFKRALISYYDAQYDRDNLFHETVVSEDDFTITRLRT